MSSSQGLNIDHTAEQMKLAEQAMGLLKVSNPASSVRHFHDQVYDKSAQFEGAGRPGGGQTITLIQWLKKEWDCDFGEKCHTVR